MSGPTIGPADPNARPRPLPASWRRSEKSWAWDVASLCQVGGAGGVGGGVFFFNFRSGSLVETFLFVAAGLGVGGSVGGASLPDFHTGRISYSPLTVRRAFSVYDLDMSPGTLTSAGVGLAEGYTLLRISAFNLGGILFEPSDCSGWSAGVALGLYGMAGYWRSLSVGTAAMDEQMRRSL